MATAVAAPAVQALGRDAPGSTCGELRAPIGTRAAGPAGFPIPPGTRLSDRYTNAAGTTVVVGFAPLPLRAAVSWYRRHALAAGYRSTWVDAERGEAEARVVRARASVLWRVNAVSGCARASVVTLELSGRPSRAGTGANSA